MVSCIHYYYGDGKGKTTAAIGQAIRSSNMNKVLYCQFLKKNNTNEINVLKTIKNIEVFVLEWNYPFTFEMNQTQLADSKKELLDYFRAIEKKIDSGDYRTLILDEIGDAIQLDFLNEDLVLGFLEKRPEELEVVMTGHQKIASFTKLVDYQTFFKKEKHPYDRGLPARKGIEY